MNDIKGKIVELDLNDVLPNRFQPRIKFNEESIIELSESVKEHGVIQPIIVRPIGDKYEIVAGERRYKACVLAGITTIPAVIIDLNDKDSVEVALIENVQRKDLTPIEEAISYKKILDMGYLTQEQLASKLGKSQSTIANKKRLLNLCDEVQEALMEEKISERHARSLLRLEHANDQREMLNRIIKERLTVRKLDEEINKFLEQKKENENNLINENKIEEDKEKDENLNILNLDEENDEDEIIDISSLFSNLNNIKDDNIDEVELEKIEDISKDKKDIEEEKEEKDNMISNGPNTNNINYNNGSQQIISSKSFGRFFDPSYFEENENKDETTDFQFNNEPTNMINPDVLSSQIVSDYQGESQPVLVSSNNPSQPVDTNQSTTMFPDLMQNQNTNMVNNPSDDFIDAQTLNQVLDPTFVDGQKQVEAPVNKEIIDSSVFAKFLDPEFEMPADSPQEASNVNSTENNTVIPSMSFAQYLNSDKPVEEFAKDAQTPSAFTMTPEVNSQPFSGLVANDSKPDLMAPMSSTPTPVAPDVNELQPVNSPLIFNTPAPIETVDNPSMQSLTPDTSVERQPAPDLLAPSNFNTEPVINQEPEQPIFVTASQASNDYSMPSNPIIDNVDINQMLGKTEEVTTPEINVDMNQPVPTEPVVNQEPISNVIPAAPSPVAPTPTETMPSQINNNQPIIITDYNKQYDPVLPADLQPKKPKIDFKQILNMIRSLNDQIEALGFEIDTDEYDLDGVYQVIFKINKEGK